MVSIVLFGSLILLILIGVPIGFALGISTLVVILGFETTSLMFQAKSVVDAAQNYPLLAVPLFILAGDLMYSGGLSKRIIDLFDSLVGHLRAGLAYVTVLASSFFAAISGSAPATVAAVGTNVIPEMEKRGYSREYGTALTASSGIIGVMIPPSIPFIIYGVAAEVSVGQLFIAGIVPGLVFAVAFMGVAYVLYRRSNFQIEAHKFEAKKVWVAAKRSVWSILAPVIILGGIYGGVLSPTEAAGIAVIYALFVGTVIYRGLKWKNVISVISQSALTSATVLPLVIFAAAFGQVLNLERVPTTIASALTDFSTNQVVILLLIIPILLVVGMFMETIASIIILTPILLPVAVAVGVDPLLFGVIMAIALAIGFVTPPLGVNLFVASAVSGLSIEKIVRSIIPYLLVMIVVLILITFVPSISMTLPYLMQ